MLLASTAFTGAFIAVIAGHPQSALAQCAGENTGSVTCEAATPAAAGTLSTTFNGATIVNVNNGAAINSGGATATVSGAGNALTFNHNDAAGIQNVVGNGVTLNTVSGNITYLGNGNVTGAASGISAASGPGSYNITNNATVSGAAFGVFASAAGTGSLTVNGTGNFVGGFTGIAVLHTGTGPAAGTNGIVVSGSGNASGGAGGTGIVAQIANAANASNILVDRGGTASGTVGIFAATTGAGNITVSGASSVTATTGRGIDIIQNNNAVGTNGSLHVGGSGSVSATGEIGIAAQITGANNAGSILVDRSGTVSGTTGITVLTSGTGGIHVGGTGSVSATGGTGIQAQIVNAINAGSILVDRAGAVSGATGIFAATTGTGSVTVTGGSSVIASAGRGIDILQSNNVIGTNGGLHVGGSGSVSATGHIGIAAQIQGANNAGSVLVDRSGAVSGTIGIFSRTLGTGNVTVNVSNDVTGTGGIGVQATALNGLSSVNVTGGTIHATARGINATSNGTGGVTVNMTGGQIGTLASRTGASGINVASAGTAGNVTVTATDIFATAAGIDAITTGASSGNIAITANGAIDALNGAGIGAAHLNAAATGDVTVTQNGSVRSANDRGIAASTFGSGNVLVTGAGSVFGGGGIGIGAAVLGSTGGVTVSGSGAVTSANSNAIVASILNAANNSAVLVDRSGPISGTQGIFASSPGGGAVTVNVSNNVTGTLSSAVDASAAGGLATVNVTGGTLLAGDIGISAISLGTGGVRVNMTAGEVGTAAQRTGGIGIYTQTNGASGDVNITANTVFSTGDGIRTTFTNPASSGNVNVAVNAGATVNSSTGIGVNLQNGNLNTIANLGAISGTTAVQTATGSTTVTNAGSMTGAGGTAVQLGGANNVFIMDGPGATLSGNAVGSGTDTFRFAGAGSNAFDVSQIGAGWTLIDKTGSSNWTLTGTATYAGPTTVSAGTLLVNGSLASSSGLTVASGATVGGTGTLPSTTINAGGTLSPGNSIGTINISGNLSFVGAGNYIVEVNGTSSDKTVVTGTATLGGTVQVVPLTRLTTRTTYTILNGSPLAGTFGSATVQAGNNFARNPVLAYVGGDVLLTLDPGLLAPLLSGAATPNQRSVAGGIDNAITAGNPLTAFDPLFALSATQLPAALDQLSGEVHASTAGVLADESLYARSAILGRLRQASYGGNTSMAALSTGGPQAFAGDPLPDPPPLAGEGWVGALAYVKSPIVRKAPMAAPQPTSDIVFWAQGFGAWGRFNGDGNAARAQRDLAGFFTGIDTSVAGNGRVGIAAGYTGSKNNLDGRGSANVETGHIAGYGGWNFGALNLRAGGDFAFHSIATDRTINFPGFFDHAFANYDGHTGQIFGELGYGFALANIAVEPFAGAAWVRVKTDAAAERGGAAALNFAGTTFETGYTTLGVRAASMVPIGHDMILIPRASVAWQHAFDAVTPNAVLAFQAAPAVPFTIAGVPIARDALLAEAGVDLAIGRNATVGVSYTGQVARNVTDHAAKGKFSWKF